MNTFRRKELNSIAKKLTALREKLEAFMRTSMKHTTICLKVCKTSKEEKQCVDTSAILKTILESS